MGELKYNYLEFQYEEIAGRAEVRAGVKKKKAVRKIKIRKYKKNFIKIKFSAE